MAVGASGLAQTGWWLIAARVVQGFGATAFFAASLSIVSNAFPPKERSKGIGLWAGIGTVGLARANRSTGWFESLSCTPSIER